MKQKYYMLKHPSKINHVVAEKFISQEFFSDNNTYVNDEFLTVNNYELAQWSSDNELYFTPVSDSAVSNQKQLALYNTILILLGDLRELRIYDGMWMLGYWLQPDKEDPMNFLMESEFIGEELIYNEKIFKKNE